MMSLEKFIERETNLSESLYGETKKLAPDEQDHTK